MHVPRAPRVERLVLTKGEDVRVCDEPERGPYALGGVRAGVTIRDEKWRLQHSLPMSGGGGAWTFTLFGKPPEDALDVFVVEAALLPPLEHGGGNSCGTCLRGERHGADDEKAASAAESVSRYLRMVNELKGPVVPYARIQGSVIVEVVRLRRRVPICVQWDAPASVADLNEGSADRRRRTDAVSELLFAGSVTRKPHNVYRVVLRLTTGSFGFDFVVPEALDMPALAPVNFHQMVAFALSRYWWQPDHGIYGQQVGSYLSIQIFVPTALHPICKNKTAQIIYAHMHKEYDLDELGLNVIECDDVSRALGQAAENIGSYYACPPGFGVQPGASVRPFLEVFGGMADLPKRMGDTDDEEGNLQRFMGDLARHAPHSAIIGNGSPLQTKTPCHGARVRLQGLAARADLNGAIAVVALPTERENANLQSRGRVKVRTETDGECLSIKLTNLQVLDDDGLTRVVDERDSAAVLQAAAASTEGVGLRVAANQQFASGKFEEALHTYDAVLRSSDAPHGIERAKILSNMAAAHLRLDRPQAALHAAEKSVVEDCTWWRGHQRSADALVRLFCFYEAEAAYGRAVAHAPTEELRRGVDASRQSCAARLYSNPMPNFKVFTLLQAQTRPALPRGSTNILSVIEGAWEATGLAKLVRDAPRTNILHSSLLHALRITHPGIALGTDGGVPVFAPRELGHIYPPSSTTFTTDLTKFQAYTPLGYCFEVCFGFLRALQHLHPDDGWVCYVIGGGTDMGHALLHSTKHNIVLDPLQLGKDPDGMVNRYECCLLSPTWTVFETPAGLIEWIGEYRAGEKEIPSNRHVARPGAPLVQDPACKGCKRMIPVMVPNPAYVAAQQHCSSIDDQD